MLGDAINCEQGAELLSPLLRPGLAGQNITQPILGRRMLSTPLTMAVSRLWVGKEPNQLPAEVVIGNAHLIFRYMMHS